MNKKVKITLKGNDILPFEYEGQMWSGTWVNYNCEYVIFNDTWKVDPKNENAKYFGISTAANKPFPYEEEFEENHCEYEDAILNAFLNKISKLYEA